jgi:N6-L-threonylcarbamoyladenine synthase
VLILGIESSCDETAAGVVDDGRRVLSNVIVSQDELHAEYGGVVPELASRRHTEVIVPVIRRALEEPGLTLGDLDGLAVTQGPGLVGSLLVGLNLAKSVSLVTGLPLAGVNHVHAHAAAGLLDPDGLDYPVAALVVSGGHTNLYRVDGPLDFVLLGKTRDDAAGEAFDKAAKLLGLGYPGGRLIEQWAETGDPERFQLPRPMIRHGLDFSFSGLKTALITLVRQNWPDRPPPDQDLADLCAGYQAAIVDVLQAKARDLVETIAPRAFVLSGGVAANSALRRAITQTMAWAGVRLILPPIRMCTDNGAMIAAMGHHLIQAGRLIGLDADAYSRKPPS